MFRYIIVAIVQGITEFLPVSSSAHMVFLRHVFGIKTNGSDFEVVLHAGSLLAVLLFYRHRIMGLLKNFSFANASNRRFIFLLATSSIPAFIVYCSWGDFIEKKFSDTFAFGYLIITGIMLLSLKFIRFRSTHEINLSTALAMGIMQALALLPGISRSGSTFWGGVVVKTDKKKTIEFSLFMSMIAIAGAVLFKANHLLPLISEVGSLNILVAFLISFITSYIAVAILIKLVESDIIWIFGIYCMAVACVAAWFAGNSKLF